MKKVLIGIACFAIGFGVALSVNQTSAASSFVEGLKGKILLQVERNGEGWYVHPDSGERYFMGTPLDAFNLMRSLGVGISNTDLDQVSISSDSAPLPAEVEKSWVTTRTYSGSTSRNTETFNILGNSFKVDWSHQGEGYFGITLYDKNGEYLELIANQVGSGSEITQIYERGEVYLEITASDEYEINILEYQ